MNFVHSDRMHDVRDISIARKTYILPCFYNVIHTVLITHPILIIFTYGAANIELEGVTVFA